MGTKREELEKMARGEGCLGKAADDEPIFILRARDMHAADLVHKWAIFARTTDCPNDKVLEAIALSEAMERWPNRKYPD